VYKLFTSDGNPFPATYLNNSLIISNVSSLSLPFLEDETLVLVVVVVSPPRATGL
jgi:hypothetical protein